MHSDQQHMIVLRPCKQLHSNQRPALQIKRNARCANDLLPKLPGIDASSVMSLKMDRQKPMHLLCQSIVLHVVSSPQRRMPINQRLTGVLERGSVDRRPHARSEHYVVCRTGRKRLLQEPERTLAVSRGMSFDAADSNFTPIFEKCRLVAGQLRPHLFGERTFGCAVTQATAFAPKHDPLLRKRIQYSGGIAHKAPSSNSNSSALASSPFTSCGSAASSGITMLANSAGVGPWTSRTIATATPSSASI